MLITHVSRRALTAPGPRWQCKPEACNTAEFIAAPRKVLFPPSFSSCCSSPSQNPVLYSPMLLFLSSPIKPIQLFHIADTRGFGFGIRGFFKLLSWQIESANSIGSHRSERRESGWKMWLQVWVEKAVIPPCLAESCSIRLIPSCRTPELQRSGQTLLQAQAG